MLFSVVFIFCLFVVTSVGATGSSSPATGAANREIRKPNPGEIVEVRTGKLNGYVSWCYIP